MFKVIKLDVNNVNISIKGNSNFTNYNITELLNTSILNKENFSRTVASVDNDTIVDLNQRSSWTNNYEFILETKEANNFFKNNNIIDESSEYKLLRYEEGDFFNNHLDRKLSDNHKYTCLIFFNDESTDVEGGELSLQDENDLYGILFNPSNLEGLVMVIFSIDLYHEVSQITKGVRYVFKKPLFVNEEENIDTQDNDSYEGMLMDCGHGDY